MYGLIGVIFSAFGFMGNLLLIVIIYLFITNALSDLIYKGFQKIYSTYRNIRTSYYRMLIAKNPDNAVLKDKWRRSEMHSLILGMQSYILYLKEKHGGFFICPNCKFPQKPSLDPCQYCRHLEENIFNREIQQIK